MASSPSEWWPERIGRLVLRDDLALIVARYDDPLTGAEYRAGREQGGRRRRGWWVLRVDASVRSGGYRDFSPRSQEQAIRRLRSMASATVGVGEWSNVSVAAEIETSDQGALDQWGTA